MDHSLYISFLIVSFSLIIIPGPNILVIISNSVRYGRSHGLQTVAGTSLAMAIQLFIVGLGTTWLIGVFTEGFYLLKWLGVGYLFYLGFKYFMRALNSKDSLSAPACSVSFARGFIVSLTNPKTLLFFSAFLPQFISSTENYSFQISLLSLSFLLLAIIIDSAYAILSAKLLPLLQKNKFSGLQNGLSSILYLAASIWLATLRRIQ